MSRGLLAVLPSLLDRTEHGDHQDSPGWDACSDDDATRVCDVTLAKAMKLTMKREEEERTCGTRRAR